MKKFRAVLACTFAAGVALLALLLCRDWQRSALAPPPHVSRAVIAGRPCADAPAPDDYFPSGVFEPKDEKSDQAQREYYASFLQAMERRPLFCGSSGGDVFRLTRLEYVGSPVSIDVTLNRGAVALLFVQLEAPTWRQPRGRIVAQRGDALRVADWEAVVAAAGATDFWAMATGERHPTWDGPGSAWIIEGRSAGVYHVVVRASPPPGAFREFGALLLRLANVTEPQLSGPQLR